MNKEILYDTPEAAQKLTIEEKANIDIWKTSNGILFFDENMARFSGCTHVKCSECGKKVEKGWTKCKFCRDKQDKEKWNKLPKVDWDGKSPLFSHLLNEYFFDIEDLFFEVEPYTKENNDSGESYVDERIEDLMLVFCRANPMKDLNLIDFYEDILPDNDYYIFSNELLRIEEEFNKAVMNHPPISYTDDKIAVTTKSVRKTLEI